MPLFLFLNDRETPVTLQGDNADQALEALKASTGDDSWEFLRKENAPPTHWSKGKRRYVAKRANRVRLRKYTPCRNITDQ